MFSLTIIIIQLSFTFSIFLLFISKYNEVTTNSILFNLSLVFLSFSILRIILIFFTSKFENHIIQKTIKKYPNLENNYDEIIKEIQVTQKWYIKKCQPESIVLDLIICAGFMICTERLKIEIAYISLINKTQKINESFLLSK